MFEFLNSDFDLFSESSVEDENYSAELTEEEDAMMESFESIPCPEDDLNDAVMRITLETVENYHAMVEAITFDEIKEFMVTHEEVVYEEGRIKTITSKITAFIQNAWQKIKGLFDKVFTAISNAVKNDEKFLKANEKAIKKFSGEIDMKGYNYTNLSADPYTKIMATFKKEFDSMNITQFSDAEYGNATRMYKSDANKTEKFKDNIADKLRGAAVGKDKCSSSEFKNELKKYFAGSSDKEKIKMSPDEVISTIKDAKKIKAAAKASYDACKKYFKSMIDDAKRVEKQAIQASSRKEVKENNISRYIGAYSAACRHGINVATVVIHAQVQAINAAHRQARAVGSYMANKSGSSKKSTNESALDALQFN